MKHIKLFEEFAHDIDEGAIPVYPPGNPWKNHGSIQWTKVKTMLTDPGAWKKEYNNPTNYTLVADIDFDKYTADSKFQSIPLGTWGDTSLPLFKEKNPKYDESEFDFMEVVDNPSSKRSDEPWIKVQDKNGVEFLIHPSFILDIQIGSSIKDGILSGEKYLIDSMRAKISDYKNGTVFVTMQDGTKKEFTLEEWKKKHYTPLDDNAHTEFKDEMNESNELVAKAIEKNIREQQKLRKDITKEELRKQIKPLFNSHPELFDEAFDECYTKVNSK